MSPPPPSSPTSTAASDPTSAAATAALAAGIAAYAAASGASGASAALTSAAMSAKAKKRGENWTKDQVLYLSNLYKVIQLIGFGFVIRFIQIQLYGTIHENDLFSGAFSHTRGQIPDGPHPRRSGCHS